MNVCVMSAPEMQQVLTCQPVCAAVGLFDCTEELGLFEGFSSDDWVAVKSSWNGFLDEASVCSTLCSRGPTQAVLVRALLVSD